MQPRDPTHRIARGSPSRGDPATVQKQLASKNAEVPRETEALQQERKKLQNPIGIVYRSTGALRHVEMPDGGLLGHGKEVMGLINGEEEEVGLIKIVPFLIGTRC